NPRPKPTIQPQNRLNSRSAEPGCRYSTAAGAILAFYAECNSLILIAFLTKPEHCSSSTVKRYLQRVPDTRDAFARIRWDGQNKGISLCSVHWAGKTYCYCAWFALRWQHLAGRRRAVTIRLRVRQPQPPRLPRKNPQHRRTARRVRRRTRLIRKRNQTRIGAPAP